VEAADGNLQGWHKQLRVLKLPELRCSGTSEVGPAWEVPGDGRLMNYREGNKW